MEELGYCPKCRQFTTVWAEEWLQEKCTIPDCCWHGPFKLDGKSGVIRRPAAQKEQPPSMSSDEVLKHLEAGECVVCRNGTGVLLSFTDFFNTPEEAQEAIAGDSHAIVIKKA